MSEPLKVLDLFSGIGGFSLGLERTGGFKTVAFCEIEDYPRRVLAKHWPGVPIYEDVRELTADRLRADGISVDVITGGFPCQDISVAGKGAGIEGARSGLWSEVARLTGELRPRYVILENVSALLGRGLGKVLGDLAEIGYDAEWHCIPASAIGAPHRRDRIWIIAYASSVGVYDLSGSRNLRNKEWNNPKEELRRNELTIGLAADGKRGPLAYSESKRRRETERDSQRYEERIAGSGEVLAYPQSIGFQRMWTNWEQVIPAYERSRISSRGDSGRSRPGRWLPEPSVGRVANGVPRRADRLKGLGNAVVPQLPELIGNAILESMQ